MQKEFKEGLVSEIKPIRERMKNLPKAIIFPQFPSIPARSDDGEENGEAIIGDIAVQYLRMFASDKTFGFLDKNGTFTLESRKQQ